MNNKWFSLSWAALSNHSYIIGVIQLNYGPLAGSRSQQPVANFYYRALRWIRPESQQRKAVHRFYATLPLPGNCPSPALFESGAVYTPALCLATTHTYTHQHRFILYSTHKQNYTRQATLLNCTIEACKPFTFVMRIFLGLDLIVKSRHFYTNIIIVDF